MRPIVAACLILFSSTAIADESILLARFAVLRGASDSGTKTPAHSLTLRVSNGLVEGERVVSATITPLGFGTFSSKKLLDRLGRLSLPTIDYQKYFDDLAKQPPVDGHQWWTTEDGQEVEVELHINGVTVHFKMWNPDSFFYSYEGDKVVAEVSRALDIFAADLNRSAICF